MTISAKETEYKGHNFRSRLEARWAVVFDSLLYDWQYEPQGFDLSSGASYLPDFHLPEEGLWVEIKGSEKSVSDVEMIKFSEFSAEIGVTGENAIMVLGDIPRYPFVPVIVSSLGGHNSGFVGQSPMKFLTEERLNKMHLSQSFWSPSGDTDRTVSAFDNGRSARFEFGESGAKFQVSAGFREKTAIFEKRVLIAEKFNYTSSNGFSCLRCDYKTYFPAAITKHVAEEHEGLAT